MSQTHNTPTVSVNVNKSEGSVVVSYCLHSYIKGLFRCTFTCLIFCLFVFYHNWLVYKVGKYQIDYYCHTTFLLPEEETQDIIMLRY